MTVWGFLDVRRRGYPYPTSPQEHRTDFTVYTEAGAAFFDGRPPYEVANPRGWTYLYPPLFALLMAPLHALPMQDQVTVWFFLSLLFCWGCYAECRRIVAIVCREDARVAATWARWFPWLGAATLIAAVLPALNCLQRGQVGLMKLYLLLLGLRVILGGRSYRAWITGGIVLSLPVVLKIVPVMPVGFFIFLELVDLARRWWSNADCRRRLPTPMATVGGLESATGIVSYHAQSATGVASYSTAPVGPRFAASSLGFALGLLMFILLLPATLVGWDANLRHLDTWGRFMLTKADDGGVDPRSGNSRTSRNQSLQNAVYRLGNFAAHVCGDGPDDRLVEQFRWPPMAMDRAEVQYAIMFARAALALALAALGLRLARGDGNRLNLAAGFSVACVAMLVISPVARGHYFMFLSPAALLVPLWLVRRGRSRAAAAMAVVPAMLPPLHYLLLPYAGRIGLMGLGTAAWLMAMLVLMARADRRAAAGASTPADGIVCSSEPVAKAA